MHSPSASTLTLEWEALMDKDVITLTSSEQNTLLLDQGEVRAELGVDETKNSPALTSSIRHHGVGLEVCASTDTNDSLSVMRPEDLIDLASCERVLFIFADRAILAQGDYSHHPLLVTISKLTSSLLLCD